MKLHSDYWFDVIETLIGAHCIKAYPEISNETYGYNGYISAVWQLNTCLGNKKYIVSYYPKEHFPNKINEYEVVEHNQL